MWSIGIRAGESPFHLVTPQGIVNPVLTCESVSDVPARFVADPFMVRRDGVWHMFFEVLNEQTNKGEIGLATSDNGLKWKYRQIILTEPFHLSYPCVFEWNEAFYMIPETLKAEAVRLYKADDFPVRWSPVGQLIKAGYADPSIFRFDERWWMFVCSTPYLHDTLRLYFAEDLCGPWAEHPASPIVQGDKRRARPGGRVLVHEDKIIRFAQDCHPRYGAQLRAFEISELTINSYVETEHRDSPVLRASGNGWNGLGMHHLDAHLLPDGRWLACVDGFSGRE
ncbi:MAG: hypothetical protein H7Y30_12175 [Pyrinomonadaceae bacterium]|nr:hypothetical protein [Pyrinomonadaceae bacterium]